MKPLLLIHCAALLAIYTPSVQAQIGQWSAPINVSNTPRYSINPDMAIGPDGRIHVVWSDNSRLLSYDDNDIIYSVYSENSSTWSAPVQLSPMESTYSGDSHIAIDSLGRPHVVWTHRNLYPDADIYYSELNDSGWAAPLNLTPVGVGRSSDIAIDQRGYIHVVWNQLIGGVWNINHRYCKNGLWSNPINASNSSIDVSQPRLVAGLGNELHLVWVKPTSGENSDIYYSKYDGLSWSIGQNVSNDPGEISDDPNLTADPQGHPHVVWTEYSGLNLKEIFYSYFNGLFWSYPQNISNMGMLSKFSCIAANCSNSVCVLFSTQTQSGQPPHGFYALKQGTHWITPDTILNDYIIGQSAIIADQSGIYHSCLEIVPPDYEDIGYTKYEVINSRLNSTGIFPNINSALNIFPNPFNQSTKITYSIITSSNTSLFIFDMCGCLIKSLSSAAWNIGPREIIWDGTNQYGIKISSGTYIVELKIENQVIINKIYLIK